MKKFDLLFFRIVGCQTGLYALWLFIQSDIRLWTCSRGFHHFWKNGGGFIRPL